MLQALLGRYMLCCLGAAADRLCGAGLHICLQHLGELAGAIEYWKKWPLVHVTDA